MGRRDEIALKGNVLIHGSRSARPAAIAHYKDQKDQWRSGHSPRADAAISFNTAVFLTFPLRIHLRQLP